MEYKSENRICQNCKNDFTIEPDDFLFYEKIKVPPPTFCPNCRRIRRWVWRNERTYYKRKCNVPNHSEEIVSLYSPEQPFFVYDQKYWWSDQWDPLDYGVDYDFSESFFKQFSKLLKNIPLITLSNTEAINSEYCSSTAWNKDCYLISASGWNEKVLYSNRLAKNKDSMDLYIADNNELCYEDLYCNKCYQTCYSNQCEGCSDSMFLHNCRNCSNCFGCTNLMGQDHCFFNKKLPKEEYKRKIAQLNLGSSKEIQKIKRKFYEEIYLNTINKYSDQINCINSTGDHLRNTKNCHECYDFPGDNNEDCKFVDWGGFKSKDIYDTGPGVGWNTELVYEGVDNNDDSNMIGCIVCYNSNNLFYCMNCHGSSNLFACIGLRNKKYCILNKQYTKEEYDEIILKIKKQMEEIPYIDRRGMIYKYGEFFPSELSPFAYNETVAQEYNPLTKEQALEQGYKWKDKEERNYQIDIKNEDIPDNIKDITDDIIGKVIECGHKGECNQQCTEAFKIIPEELQFYQRMNLPLPRLCPNCRHYERLSQRNPLKLWHRSCMKEGCNNEFETSYSPDRPEIVYCERCYQNEVY
ncbi:MAG: hypothetical protein WC908_00215 [Candidatus Paceibacterota bacterium]